MHHVDSFNVVVEFFNTNSGLPRTLARRYRLHLARFEAHNRAQSRCRHWTFKCSHRRRRKENKDASEDGKESGEAPKRAQARRNQATDREGFSERPLLIVSRLPRTRSRTQSETKGETPWQRNRKLPKTFARPRLSSPSSRSRGLALAKFNEF